MKQVLLILFLLLPGLSRELSARDAGNDSARIFTLKGYLDNLNLLQFEDVQEEWYLDDQLQNRLDFDLFPAPWFRMGVGMRNRLIFGQTLTLNPDYKKQFNRDDGLVNMTWPVCSGSSYILVAELDRAWMTVTAGNLQVTAGRQRINWGQTLVWNPNDIFNTYSFFALDYPERQGSDALRLQFYPSHNSVVEGAVKWNREGRITVAGLGRFNVSRYDIQLLAGLVDDRDYVAGFGWSGNISKAGFRGEMSYFHPKENAGDTTGVISATIGADYVFRNSVSLTAQVFYNQLPDDFQPVSMVNVYLPPSSPKVLSFTDWNIFLQASYPFTPIFSGTLSGIYYPSLEGYFIGPAIQLSLMQNLDLDAFIQYFNVLFKDQGPMSDQNVRMRNFTGALILKWSF